MREPDPRRVFVEDLQRRLKAGYFPGPLTVRVPGRPAYTREFSVQEARDLMSGLKGNLKQQQPQRWVPPVRTRVPY